MSVKRAMWTASQLSISAVCIVLSFTVSMLAWRKHGFMAPLGFFVSRIIYRIVIVSTWLVPFSRDKAESIKDRFKLFSASLEPDKSAYIFSTLTQSPGILESAGYLMFFLCALLDLQLTSRTHLRRSRVFILVMGCTLCTASQIYPIWTMFALAPDISFANQTGL